MGWVVTLGVLTLLAVLPLGVSVKYDGDGAVVKLIAGPAKITLFPRPKKDKKTKKEKTSEKTEQVQVQKEPTPKTAEKAPQSGAAAGAPKAEQTVQPEDQPAKKEPKSASKKGGPITDFLPLVQTALDMLGAFRRRLRVNMLELKLVMVADDPCDLAVNYGRAWAAVGNLMPRLERVFVIKKRNIEVQCDFEAAKTLVIARLDLTITLGRLLATVVVFGVKAFIQFLKINKKRKGGVSK